MLSPPADAFAEPRSLVDEAVRVITERIVRGEFPPGMRLVEEQLAREFGISRPPIRESFRILEREGLVINRPRRGVCVKPISPREVREIYLCRSVLAGLAARLTAQQMTPELLRELRVSLERLTQLAEAGDAAGYHDEIGHFHGLVVEASQSEQVQRLLQSLVRRVRRLSFTSLSLPGRLQASLAFHRRLVAAFEQKDAVEAERCSRELLEDAIEPLVSYLQTHATEAVSEDSAPSSVSSLAPPSTAAV